MSQSKEPLTKDCQDEVIQVHDAHDQAIHGAACADIGCLPFPGTYAERQNCLSVIHIDV